MKPTLRMLTAAWPLVICLPLPALTRGEIAIQAWVRRYNGPGMARARVCMQTHSWQNQAGSA